MTKLPDIKANRAVYSVSSLTRSAKQLLEGEFPSVFVEGEISNFATPASGHWYFTLKDAKSQIRSAMFKGRNRMIRFVPRNGLQIVVRGKISLYEGRGDFQMIAEHMEEAGDGALKRAFERLKEKLRLEGLFEDKQALPTLIQHLAIVTSPTGAAIADVLHVLKRRFPAMQVTIIPSAVQGDDSIGQLVTAIEIANQTHHQFDALLLTRGGGSLEDLWSFNTEPVARAIAASELPIVAAVGHETDFTIADFVADIRAPTPSAAAELLSPDTDHWLGQLDNTRQRLASLMTSKQRHLSSELQHLSRRLRHPGQRLQELSQRIDDLEARLRSSLQPTLNPSAFNQLALRLSHAMQRRLMQKKQNLEHLRNRIHSPQEKILSLSARLEALSVSLKHQQSLMQINRDQRLANLTTRLDAISPLKTLSRGYAIATRAGGEVIKQAAEVEPGERIEIRLSTSSFEAQVTTLEPSAKPLVEPLAGPAPKEL